MRGGAEKMLKVLADMYPEAPIYTLLYDEKKLGDLFPRERIRFSPLQKFAALSTNHHHYLSRFPKAVESWDFSGYDLVISSSSAFAHGIKTSGKTKHLSYIHSPARYLWDQTFDVLGRTNFLQRKYLEGVFHKLRTWDAHAAERGDMILAASKEVQRRIELYWRRGSTVLYPCVDDFWLENECKGGNREHMDYFLIVSQLAKYKRIDLAIEACNQLGVHLNIVGEGADRSRLEKLAGPTIEFWGYRGLDELGDLYEGARATIFPGFEDFGIVPLESMACGTPVIAYGKGGALETIIDGQTGSFFHELSSKSLAEAIAGFDPHVFNALDCKKQARKFSRGLFEEGIRSAVESIVNS